MAETLLTVQDISKTGIDPTFAAAAAGGNKFANTGRTTLRVVNGDSGPHTVTIHAQKPCSQGTLHDVAVVVAAGAEEDIGPFDSIHYSDASGLAHATYSAVTSVTVGAFELG